VTRPGVKSAAEILAEAGETARESAPDGRRARLLAPEERDHGSVKGASQHRRRGEPLCPACAEAERVRKSDSAVRARAWRAAVRRLAAAHRAEFLRYFNEEKGARGL
jgi:hypothetical protein